MNTNADQHRNDDTLTVSGNNDALEKVADSYGLLEHILSYSHAIDLLSASLSNTRWKQAARDDTIWKNAAIHVWKDKVGMPLVRRGNSIAVFWRTFVKRHVLEKMSVKDIKGLFAERPLGRRAVRDAFSACLEKSDMQTAAMQLMPMELGGDNYGMADKVLEEGFDDLWFGCFASSVIDSRRATMTRDELLSRKGFLMHWKVYQDNDALGLEEDVMLHFHGIVYFDEDDSVFRMDDPEEMHHPRGLTWQWVVEGKAVQVDQYPPLVVHRLENWGWRLENQHVILYSQ